MIDQPERCRLLPDPDGEMVVFHASNPAQMEGEWISFHESLLQEPKP